MVIINKSDKTPKEATLTSNVWLSRHETLTLFSGLRLSITSKQTAEYNEKDNDELRIN